MKVEENTLKRNYEEPSPCTLVITTPVQFP